MPKDPLESAKAVLAKANRDFPHAKPAATASPANMAPDAVTAPPPAAAPRQGIREGNIRAVSDVARGAGMKGVGSLGVMHDGGTVPKTGDYTLEEGETVIPADKSAGRGSEYRKVYVARRQSRQGGGNTPAKGEKHDQKKA